MPATAAFHHRRTEPLQEVTVEAVDTAHLAVPVRHRPLPMEHHLLVEAMVGTAVEDHHQAAMAHRLQLRLLLMEPHQMVEEAAVDTAL